MSKQPTPKSDQLRALREANFERNQQQKRAALPALKEKVAAIPAKKPKKAKPHGRN